MGGGEKREEDGRRREERGGWEEEGRRMGRDSSTVSSRGRDSPLDVCEQSPTASCSPVFVFELTIEYRKIRLLEQPGGK